MFKNSQNPLPVPTSILGTVRDSLATLGEKEVTFFPTRSFCFSELRATSNTVSDKISPTAQTQKRSSKRSWIQPSIVWQILTNQFQAEVTNQKYNLGLMSILRFQWLSEDPLANEELACDQNEPCDCQCTANDRRAWQHLCRPEETACREESAENLQSLQILSDHKSQSPGLVQWEAMSRWKRIKWTSLVPFSVHEETASKWNTVGMQNGQVTFI